MIDLAARQLEEVRPAVLRIARVGEETYQELCIYVHKHHGDFDWSRPQSGRLVRLARTIANRLRRRIPNKKAPRCFSDLEFDASVVEDRREHPGERREIHRKLLLQEALSCLPARRRLALEWYAEGSKDEKSASLLGVRRDLIRQWRRRDIRRLREMIALASNIDPQ